jgi:hypothetical protein
VDLKLPHHIDPGHVVGEDGKRYLFLSGGDRVRPAAGRLVLPDHCCWGHCRAAHGPHGYCGALAFNPAQARLFEPKSSRPRREHCFLSLRPAIYAAGAGEVRIREVRYRAL